MPDAEAEADAGAVVVVADLTRVLTAKEMSEMSPWQVSGLFVEQMYQQEP